MANEKDNTFQWDSVEKKFYAFTNQYGLNQDLQTYIQFLRGEFPKPSSHTSTEQTKERIVVKEFYFECHGGVQNYEYVISTNRPIIGNNNEIKSRFEQVLNDDAGEQVQNNKWWYQKGIKDAERVAMFYYPEDFDTMPLGIYRIHWAGGGTGLAAVGNLHNGTRWFAPCNWTNVSEKNVTSTMPHQKKSIAKMELICDLKNEYEKQSLSSSLNEEKKQAQEKDWEVVDYMSNEEFVHKSVRGNCESFGCKIHSVRRNSDGCVFSVGDEILVDYTIKGYIQKFNTWAENEITAFNGHNNFSLSTLQKLRTK